MSSGTIAAFVQANKLAKSVVGDSNANVSQVCRVTMRLARQLYLTGLSQAGIYDPLSLK